VTDSYFAEPDLPLTVTVRRHQAGIRLELTGELDLRTEPLLLGAIDSLLPRPGGPVMVDCTALRFIDARGLATLLRAQATLTDAGYGLAVTNPSAALRRILSATGLTSTLPERSRPKLDR